MGQPSQLPLFVVADDVTGAAEIAAVACDRGFSVTFQRGPLKRPIRSDVVVLDTGTRLLAPAPAARRVAAVLRSLPPGLAGRLFKKTDSILRGPVLAELTVCLRLPGVRRTLLVPANPSRGRVIVDGHYLINGIPLDRTPFARDPHHPRTAATVLELLTANRLTGPLVCLPTTAPLPDSGLVVGEAENQRDIKAWAARLSHDTLPAGGADFFGAWLDSKARRRRHPHPLRLPTGGTLLINGSPAAPRPLAPFAIRSCLLKDCSRSAVTKITATLSARLERSGLAVLTTPPRVSDRRSTSAAYAAAGARVAHALLAADAFRHLLIAGGSTADAIFAKLGWTEFSVLHSWGDGIATLQPTKAPEVVVTIKPGSYPWPEPLKRGFASLVDQCKDRQ